MSSERRKSPMGRWVKASAVMLLAIACQPAWAADTPAKPSKQVPPSYPPEAARFGVEGWVELEFTVGLDGKVTGVSVVKAKPARTFEQEAVKTIKKWTFDPATKDGQPVSSINHVTINFTL